MNDEELQEQLMAAAEAAEAEREAEEARALEADYRSAEEVREAEEVDSTSDTAVASFSDDEASAIAGDYTSGLGDPFTGSTSPAEEDEALAAIAAGPKMPARVKTDPVESTGSGASEAERALVGETLRASTDSRYDPTMDMSPTEDFLYGAPPSPTPPVRQDFLRDAIGPDEAMDDPMAVRGGEAQAARPGPSAIAPTPPPPVPPVVADPGPVPPEGESVGPLDLPDIEGMVASGMSEAVAPLAEASSVRAADVLGEATPPSPEDEDEAYEAMERGLPVAETTAATPGAPVQPIPPAHLSTRTETGRRNARMDAIPGFSGAMAEAGARPPLTDEAYASGVAADAADLGATTEPDMMVDPEVLATMDERLAPTGAVPTPVPPEEDEALAAIAGAEIDSTGSVTRPPTASPPVPGEAFADSDFGPSIRGSRGGPGVSDPQEFDVESAALAEMAGDELSSPTRPEPTEEESFEAEMRRMGLGGMAGLGLGPMISDEEIAAAYGRDALRAVPNALGRFFRGAAGQQTRPQTSEGQALEAQRRGAMERARGAALSGTMANRRSEADRATRSAERAEDREFRSGESRLSREAAGERSRSAAENARVRAGAAERAARARSEEEARPHFDPTHEAATQRRGIVAGRLRGMNPRQRADLGITNTVELNEYLATLDGMGADALDVVLDNINNGRAIRGGGGGGSGRLGRPGSGSAVSDPTLDNSRTAEAATAVDAIDDVSGASGGRLRTNPETGEIERTDPEGDLPGVGPIDSRVNNLLGSWSAALPEALQEWVGVGRDARSLNRALANITDLQQRDRSGAAAPDAEVARFQELLAHGGSEEEVLAAANAMRRGYMRRIIREGGIAAIDDVAGARAMAESMGWREEDGRWIRGGSRDEAPASRPPATTSTGETPEARRARMRAELESRRGR
jgi:hypothetical protein